jgi:hypothetical protein
LIFNQRACFTLKQQRALHDSFRITPVIGSISLLRRQSYGSSHTLAVTLPIRLPHLEALLCRQDYKMP